MRVIIYHNVARDQQGRHINFHGYQPGQPLVPVFAYDVELLDGGLPELRHIAEQAFEAFNMPPELLTADQYDLAARYRRHGLRSLSVGDVACLGGTALACEPVGFIEVPADLNEVHVAEPGTTPLDRS